ncbi:MAG: hypothetical protein HQM10_25555 [Candidatus Riflebacteria bacterium]|nr:hypothetical protein [Candidatus Riflebacteria bacterium]
MNCIFICKFAKIKHIIEIKLVHPSCSRKLVVEEGLKQVAKYRDRIDPHADTYLVVFDRRTSIRKISWTKSLTWETKTIKPDGKKITVVVA